MTDEITIASETLKRMGSVLLNHPELVDTFDRVARYYQEGAKVVLFMPTFERELKFHMHSMIERVNMAFDCSDGAQQDSITCRPSDSNPPDTDIFCEFTDLKFGTAVAARVYGWDKR